MSITRQTDWYNMTRAELSTKAEILLYGVIGGYDWETGKVLDGKSFVKDLQDLGDDVDEIDLRIHSVGGSVWEGRAIYNALRRHSASITAHIDGMAASMATVVAMAADTVIMAEQAWFMIHNPWTMTWGDSRDLRKTADMLDKTRSLLIKAYQRHAELSTEDLEAALDEETWYTADEALEAGFIDYIFDNPEQDLQALVVPPQFAFKRLPDMAAHYVQERPAHSPPPARTAAATQPTVPAKPKQEPKMADKTPDHRTELQSFIDAFGKDAGTDYFLAGVNLESARIAHKQVEAANAKVDELTEANATLTEHLDATKAELAEYKDTVQNKLDGDDAVASGDGSQPETDDDTFDVIAEVAKHVKAGKSPAEAWKLVRSQNRDAYDAFMAKQPTSKIED